jgi:hypothetical protein
VKALLLWAARQLYGWHYAGPIEVRVFYAATGDQINLSPDTASDGLQPTPGGVPEVAPESGPTRAELLEHFLSDDPRTVLRALAEIGPCQATQVQAAVADRIQRPAFWVIWKQLQVRQLVVETSKGFALGPTWLKGLIGLAVVVCKVKLGLLRDSPV